MYDPDQRDDHRRVESAAGRDRELCQCRYQRDRPAAAAPLQRQPGQCRRTDGNRKLVVCRQRSRSRYSQMRTIGRRPTRRRLAPPDAATMAVNALKLRAERAGAGDGRVYLVVVRALRHLRQHRLQLQYGCRAAPRLVAGGQFGLGNNQAAVARAYCEPTVHHRPAILSSATALPLVRRISRTIVKPSITSSARSGLSGY